MPYKGAEHMECKVMYKPGMSEQNCAEPCPPPDDRISVKIEHTMALLKELLMAMEDTYNQIYAKQLPEIPMDKPPETVSLNGCVDIVKMQADMALSSFMEIKRGLV